LVRRRGEHQIFVALQENAGVEGRTIIPIRGGIASYALADGSVRDRAAVDRQRGAVLNENAAAGAEAAAALVRASR
jgi:hypothetical protein